MMMTLLGENHQMKCEFLRFLALQDVREDGLILQELTSEQESLPSDLWLERVLLFDLELYLLDSQTGPKLKSNIWNFLLGDPKDQSVQLLRLITCLLQSF
jgi:hypothetical protein